MKGTIVNALAVIGGAGIGMALKKGIPERYHQTIMQGLGLAVLLIGLQMALKTQNILVVVISMASGAVIGELLDIDSRLQSFGNKLSGRLGDSHGNIAEAFMTASLVFCVGAMAVVGSIQEGLTGDTGTLYAKSLLDGITATVLASGLGAGVALSSLPILAYQGSITLLAEMFSGLLSDAAVRELTAVGGLLIIGIGLMMLEIKKVKVANLLPSIPVAVLITYFAAIM